MPASFDMSGSSPGGPDLGTGLARPLQQDARARVVRCSAGRAWCRPAAARLLEGNRVGRWISHLVAVRTSRMRVRFDQRHSTNELLMVRDSADVAEDPSRWLRPTSRRSGSPPPSAHTPAPGRCVAGCRRQSPEGDEARAIGEHRVPYCFISRDDSGQRCGGRARVLEEGMDRSPPGRGAGARPNQPVSSDTLLFELVAVDPSGYRAVIRRSTQAQSAAAAVGRSFAEEVDAGTARTTRDRPVLSSKAQPDHRIISLCALGHQLQPDQAARQRGLSPEKPQVIGRGHFSCSNWWRRVGRRRGAAGSPRPSSRRKRGGLLRSPWIASGQRHRVLDGDLADEPLSRCGSPTSPRPARRPLNAVALAWRVFDAVRPGGGLDHSPGQMLMISSTGGIPPFGLPQPISSSPSTTTARSRRSPRLRPATTETPATELVVVVDDVVGVLASLPQIGLEDEPVDEGRADE